MEKEFIPYEQALTLKELGFDKPCFANYSPNFKLYHPEKNYIFNLKSTMLGNSECKVPTFSQAFRWFREKCGLTSEVSIEQYRRKTDKKWMFSITYLNEDAMYEHSKTTFETYEEAELECLKKLIEIVKKK